MTKKCPKCGVEKSLDCYSMDKTRKDGLESYCRDCRNHRAKKSRLANPEKFKSRELTYKFGITLEQYEIMEDKQGGACAICKEKETTKKYGKLQKLAVDHCHETGKIRGLLCSACNTSLGKFKDSIDILKSAINYLQESKNND